MMANDGRKTAMMVVGFFLLLATWAGAILIWFSVAKMYTLDPLAVRQDGLNGTLAHFMDCGTLSWPQPDSIKDKPDRAEPFYRAMGAKCRVRQAPVVYFCVLTGIMVFLSSLAGMWALFEGRYPLYLYGIWTSVTIAMLFVSMYVLIHDAGETKKTFVNCANLHSDTIKALQLEGYVCSNDKSAPTMFIHAWRCFWAGTILSLICYFLLSLLLSLSYAASKVLVAVPIGGGSARAAV